MKCKHCGRCCIELNIEIEEVDVLREPRLLDHVKLMDRNGAIEYIEPLDRRYLLPSPCPFLTADNRCSIYPTRPNVCVALEVGGEQCFGGTA